MQVRQFTHRRDVVAFLSFALGTLLAFACMYAARVVPHPTDVVLQNTSDEELARKLEGTWIFDDLRTAEADTSEVVFDSSGAFRDEANESVYDTRWFTDHGLLYFAYRRIDGAQADGQDHLFRVIPEFGSSGDVLTIAFQGEEPHGKLRRKT